MTRYFSILAFVLLSACGASEKREPVTMSVIGQSLTMQDPDSGNTSAANALMLASTAQGLLRFDAAGQVEPGLAERWIVTDDGLSVIFRLRGAEWASGGTVTSYDVARSVRMHMAANRRNPMRAHFSNVDTVVAMTDKVVEIRLLRPDPNFLPLLAQPEMAIFKKSGTGPYRVHSQRNGVIRLRPIAPPRLDGEGEPPAVDPGKDVRIRAESASRAIVRFKSQAIRYVTGGTFANLPYATNAGVSGSTLRIEYPLGLFGLQATNNQGPIADRGVRIALSLAIDREAMTKAFGAEGWRPMISILPTSLGSAAPPSAFGIAQAAIEVRRERARSTIQSLGKAQPVTIRVALSEGPGARLIFARLASDWKKIGVNALLVKPGQNADLILLDKAAAFNNALWFLEALGCGPRLWCDPQTQSMVTAIRSIADPVERANAIAAADSKLIAEHGFIPLATPLRWSLVSADLNAWRANPQAVHPVSYLRREE
jgi:oligopeptide transport system substrate-binding protein